MLEDSNAVLYVGLPPFPRLVNLVRSQAASPTRATRNQFVSTARSKEREPYNYSPSSSQPNPWKESVGIGYELHSHKPHPDGGLQAPDFSALGETDCRQ